MNYVFCVKYYKLVVSSMWIIAILYCNGIEDKHEIDLGKPFKEQ